MATFRLPIMNANLKPDSSGTCYFDRMENQHDFSNDREELCLVFEDPGANDYGCYGVFHVPQNYASAGTEKIIIRLVVDAAISGNTLQFGYTDLALASGESADAAYGSEVTGSLTSATAEYVYEISITLGTTYAIGDDVFFHLYRDGGTDDWTGVALVTGIFFEYQDS